MYTPPFEITEKVLNLVARIVEQVGSLSNATRQPLPSPHLRKENRIKTIQSSLAIENNSLTIGQVTDIMDGKRVLGAPDEIQEVKNAIDAYNLMLQLDPYRQSDLLKAHKAMMANIIGNAGLFRSGGVGVFDQTHCVHLAPPAGRVNELMNDLFEWVKTTDAHPLVSSCVFHYEFEFIHPFADGNGRMGRMWQTLLLARWNPVFYWVPVESIVKEKQREYYAALNQSDSNGKSTQFVEFMLQCLSDALEELDESNQKSNQKSNQRGGRDNAQAVLAALRRRPEMTISQLQEKTGLSESGVKKILRRLTAEGEIKRVGPKNGGHWEVCTTK